MRPDVLAETLATTIRGLVAPMAERLEVMEKAVRSEGLDIRERVAAIDVIAKSLLNVESFADGLSARLVALETREPIPGPPGPQGEPGPAGKDGSPGLRRLRSE
jgi:hypothetical protein